MINIVTPGMLAKMAASQGVTAAPGNPQGQGAPMQGMQPQQAGVQGSAPPVSGDMAEAELRDMMTKNPQVVQEIKAKAQQLMSTGELTPQEIQAAVKLAKLALRDPNMWPQIRQFAIQQGLATEEDIPQQYDQGLLFAIIAMGEALQGGQDAAQAPMPQQGMAAPTQQGATPQAPQGQGGAPVDIKAHEGEYVIPGHVVRMKGKEFFDNLLSKYDPAQQ